MIRILVVDDHDLVRTGLRRVLEDTEDMQVIGEARTGEECIAAVRTVKPHVVLMDVSMPGMGGLEATRKLARLRSGIRVVVVSVHLDGLFPKRLLEAGADAYVTKGASMDELLLAIRTVYGGRRYIGRDVAQSLALSNLDGGRSALDHLTDRELQIMLMVSQGRTPQEISDALFLSPKTVSTYRCRLLKKLGVSSDVELTHLALRQGMIGPVSP